MKPYTIRIQPANGPAYAFTGMYPDSIAAISDAIELTWGQRVRISAQALPCKA